MSSSSVSPPNYGVPFTLVINGGPAQAPGDSKVLFFVHYTGIEHDTRLTVSPYPRAYITDFRSRRQAIVRFRAVPLDFDLAKVAGRAPAPGEHFYMEAVGENNGAPPSNSAAEAMYFSRYEAQRDSEVTACVYPKSKAIGGKQAELNFIVEFWWSADGGLLCKKSGSDSSLVYKFGGINDARLAMLTLGVTPQSRTHVMSKLIAFDTANQYLEAMLLTNTWYTFHMFAGSETMVYTNKAAWNDYWNLERGTPDSAAKFRFFSPYSDMIPRPVRRDLAHIIEVQDRGFIVHRYNGNHNAEFYPVLSADTDRYAMSVDRGGDGEVQITRFRLMKGADTPFIHPFGDGDLRLKPVYANGGEIPLTAPISVEEYPSYGYEHFANHNVFVRDENGPSLLPFWVDDPDNLNYYNEQQHLGPFDICFGGGRKVIVGGKLTCGDEKGSQHSWQPELEFSDLYSNDGALANSSYPMRMPVALDELAKKNADNEICIVANTNTQLPAYVTMIPYGGPGSGRYDHVETCDLWSPSLFDNPKFVQRIMIAKLTGSTKYGFSLELVGDQWKSSDGGQFSGRIDVRPIPNGVFDQTKPNTAQRFNITFPGRVWRSNGNDFTISNASFFQRTNPSSGPKRTILLLPSVNVDKDKIEKEICNLFKCQGCVGETNVCAVTLACQNSRGCTVKCTPDMSVPFRKQEEKIKWTPSECENCTATETCTSTGCCEKLPCACENDTDCVTCDGRPRCQQGGAGGVGSCVESIVPPSDNEIMRSVIRVIGVVLLLVVLFAAYQVYSLRGIHTARTDAANRDMANKDVANRDMANAPRDS